MKTSKETKFFVDNLIENFAKYDTLCGFYNLDIDSIPEIELEVLASKLMLDDYDKAADSTGPDNNSYDRHMLPSLIKLLVNSLDKDNKIEFINSWKNGVINHYQDTIKELLEERLEIYNEEVLCAA